MDKQILVNGRFLTQNISGVQRFGIEIAKLLKKRHPTCIFLTPNGPIDPELKQELQPLCFGYTSGHIWEQIELPIYIKAKFPDALLLNLCNTGPLLIKKQFVTVHDVSYFINKQWFSFLFGTWYRFLIPLLAKRAIKVFTVSDFSKSEIMRLFKIKESSKILVVYNATTSIFKQKANMAKGNYILSVASLDPRKNLERLIKAFGIISSNFPEMELVLAGTSHRAFSNDLKGFIDSRTLNKIRFTGYISDKELAELYKNARLFVYISLYEGFGIPPLEAMESGCPVLVSNIESLRETCGNSATYCNHLDTQEVAQTMSSMLNKSLTIKQIDDAQAYASKYSWEYSADKIYSSIIETGLSY